MRFRGTTPSRRSRFDRGAIRVTMLLENDLYPQDTRVHSEAASLRAAGYQVEVIAPRGPGQSPHEVVDEITVHRFWLPSDRSGRIGGLLLEYFVAHVQLHRHALVALLRGTDVIHSHNPPDTLFTIGALARFLGRHFVFDQHDLFPDLLAAKFGAFPLLPVARLAQLLSVRCASLVITTNASQQAQAAQLAGGAIPTVVVRNGPPQSIVAREVQTRRGVLRDPHIVYVGALEPQDGVEAIPEVVSQLITVHGLSDLHVTVVGWGSQLGPLTAAAHRLGLGDHLTLTGRLSHSAALDVIAAADICIDVAPCTPVNHQSTMVKIGEYLALRRPTVSFPLLETRVTAGDAIAYARCGDVRDFAATVAGLAASDHWRMSLAARAASLAPSLTWDRSQAALVAAYARLGRQAA